MNDDLMWLVQHGFYPIVGEVDGKAAVVWRLSIPWHVHRRDQSPLTPGRLIICGLECHYAESGWMARFMRATSKLYKVDDQSDPLHALCTLWRKMADNLSAMRQDTRRYVGMMHALDAFEDWFATEGIDYKELNNE